MVQQADSAGYLDAACAVERELVATLYTWSGQGMEDVVPLLGTESFHAPDARALWAVFKGLWDESAPLTPALVYGRLVSGGGMTNVGGMPGLTALHGIASIPAVVPYLAREVRRLAQLRAVRAAMETIIASTANGSEATEITARGQQALIAAVPDAMGARPESAKDWVASLDGAPRRGVPIEWGRLRSCCIDGNEGTLLGQWWDEWLYLIAGRPSMGKSALTTAAALHAAVEGVPVCIESLEMSGTMLLDRLVAMMSGIPVHRLSQSGLRDTELDTISEAHRLICNLPMTIRAGEARALSQVLGRCRQWRLTRTDPDGPALIVVDYLGLIRCGAQSKEQATSAISASLKGLAAELRCPVLVCCQLNRGPEQRATGGGKGKDATPDKPRLSDLRDSGSLEQDADAVLLLSGLRRGTSGWATVSVEKQRQGPTGETTLWFNAPLTRFQEKEYEPH